MLNLSKTLLATSFALALFSQASAVANVTVPHIQGKIEKGPVNPHGGVSALASPPSSTNLRLWERTDYQGGCIKCQKLQYNTCYAVDMGKSGLSGPNSLRFDQFDTRDGYSALTFYDGATCNGNWNRMSGVWKNAAIVFGNLGQWGGNLRSFKIADFFVPSEAGHLPYGDSYAKTICKKVSSSECRF
ncbi:hypothetical protein BX616_005427 [Lobosporangium transversale]|uniref:Beta/gamma crystallin 'Greek key' domain-containing protein n=1 Tax=Lobosporangium transversale TaxID=64571 RepID=A0A1Y2GI67_9FUNG|nr:hypothetical protein BCR41DRAFT_387640 [Lobosporangium transversale]KAF9918813.1 hypothetical protein BX616_005427 [Lobosporangium transversale]ORZ11634.1 hypothetical protein BCR41DRAFT_387640 [Lobosporangium transversale]|eukprot:XP_021879731.1 hypothetical protein BCR41DRAFT_387640 [Lobosporangium transversale]